MQLYERTVGTAPVRATPIAAGGSKRHYLFLEGPRTLLGAGGTSVEENGAFIYFAKILADRGLPVPVVVAVSDDGSCYLQNWCGNDTLFSSLEHCRSVGEYDDLTMSIMGKVMDCLAKLHATGISGVDFSNCYPHLPSVKESVMWDLNYFKYCFLKAAGIEFDECAIEKDFNAIADAVALCGENEIVLRDCQSRNIVVGDNKEITFIDFQGARPGCGIYDVVSFLWQARAALPQCVKDEMIDRYISSCGMDEVAEAQWRSRLPLFVLLRTLQVLGAYGFRGLTERKEHFLRSIPDAIDNSNRLIENGALKEYPALCSTLLSLSADTRFSKKRMANSKLVVRVTSFAYKNGIPTDESGNGGGFVFDCRGIHNPGKYGCYKHLTGKDKEVVSFLEECGEVQPFLDSVWSLVSFTVKKYLKRGFNSLCVNFGCTGGRHRSVYCAEHIAHRLNVEFGVEVELTHREQGIYDTFSGK